MKTIMYMVGYDRPFKELIKQVGWGCGYVAIPVEHPLVIQFNKQKETPADEDGYYQGHAYLQVGDEEITYTESKTIQGKEYVVVGFDTAHSYNKPEHDFDYVLSRTLALQQVIAKQG